MKFACPFHSSSQVALCRIFPISMARNSQSKLGKLQTLIEQIKLKQGGTQYHCFVFKEHFTNVTFRRIYQCKSSQGFLGSSHREISVAVDRW